MTTEPYAHAHSAIHAVMAEIPSGVTRSGSVKLVHVASMAPALIQHTLHDTQAITIDPSSMQIVCNGSRSAERGRPECVRRNHHGHGED
jgi:hypothetical protein